MFLIIDNDRSIRLGMQRSLYRHTLNTCAASARTAVQAPLRFSVHTAYVPRLETIPNPIGFCRRFKLAYPKIPLAVRLAEDSLIDLDALNAVTDTIIIKEISSLDLAELLCELTRLYSGRDLLSCRAGALSLNIYARVAHIHGRLFSLTGSTISILRYLAEAHPRPVAPTELAKCTGTPGKVHTPSCVSSILSRLNQRVVYYTGQPIVSSSRGGGYRILP